MRRQAAVVFLLVLTVLGSATQVKGDFFGTLLTNFAKNVFNDGGPRAQKLDIDGGPRDEQAPIQGTDGELTFEQELQMINDKLKMKHASDPGYKPSYKEVEDLLEKQLEEDEYEMEETIVKEATDPEESIAALETLEQDDYKKLQEKTEKVYEIDGEFQATHGMADAVANKYGEDVSITVEDEEGNQYSVSSDLLHDNISGPEDSKFEENAEEIAEDLSRGKGYDMVAGRESVENWQEEETQIQDTPVDGDISEQEAIMQELQRRAKKQGTEVPRWPQYEDAKKNTMPKPSSGNMPGSVPPAGSKIGEGVVEASDESIAEGVKEGRVAKPKELMTWEELQHYEAAEAHSPRIRFHLQVLARPDPSAMDTTGVEDEYVRSVSGCVIRDIEEAAGYYYTTSDTWEPGFGVFYNNTLVNEGRDGYSITSEVEIIYPADYNPEDVERFLQRVMTVPEGVFHYTYSHHAEATVHFEPKIEYCSKDWTYWDFEGGDSNWEVKHMAEKQDAKHECWYQPKLHPQLMEWDMEDIWLLIGAMLVSGGMAVACVAALTKVCCEPSSKGYYPDGDDDGDMLPMHRRHLIAQRLAGKNRGGGLNLSSIRRKSEKLWRDKQFLPHVDHSSSDEYGEDTPSAKLRELADTYSAPTWYNNNNNDIDDKYGKKFNKQGKFTWVADYKSARRMRQQIADAESNKSDLPISSSAADLAGKDMDFSEYFGQAAGAQATRRHQRDSGEMGAGPSTTE